ncbi:MAG: helix-turn-helix transcriptional regulator [Planctomycetia bacterium]
MDSISRHEQLLRVFHLIDILFSARGPLSIAELKDQLKRRGVIDEMSEKNLRRDIDFLSKFGYAIKQTKKRNDRGASCQAWAIEVGKGVAEIRGPAVTLPELLSLAVARDFLAPLAGTFYWRGISQLMARLEKIVTPDLMAYVEEHKDGLIVHPKPARAKYAARTLNAINRAIRNRLELEIRYTSLATGKARLSTIRPEAIVLYDGSLYIAATRAGRGDDESIRFFKLDRVARAQPTSKPFVPRPETVESLLSDSITIFRSDAPPQRYRLRISAARATWAREKPFHPGQKLRDEPDGGLLVTIERAWDDEMIPQLLALGEHVEVLEPESARERLLETARQIAAQYACRHLTAFDEIVAGR